MSPKQATFTVYAKPQPQGSIRAFMIGGKPRLTSDNKKLKPYRTSVAEGAMYYLGDRGIDKPMAKQHEPVSIVFDFYLEKPKSMSKKRIRHTVKPDLDKLCRATFDSLKGVILHDDSIICDLSARKHYGLPERVEISVTILE